MSASVIVYAGSMKKVLMIIIFSLLFSENSFASGSGELKINDKVINNFQRYLSYNKPVVFLVTIDGQNSFGWRCPHNQCVHTGAMNEKKLCERRFGNKCEIFALRRSIRWKNKQTVNLKGKDKRFSSKDSLNEIKTKLTKLGFYD